MDSPLSLLVWNRYSNREVEQLGYEIVQVEDGRVTFRGGAEAVCRANIFLRTAERVLDESRQFSGKDI